MSADGAEGLIEKLHAVEGAGTGHTAKSGPDELEIKLVGDASAVRALEGSLVIRALRTGPVRTEALRNTYYDTEGGDLENAGVTLKVVEEFGALTQSVKRAQNGGAAFRRQEYDVDFDDAAAFPVTTGAPDIDALLDKTGGALAPSLHLDQDRRAVVLARGATEIEAAFDVCSARIPLDDRRASIAEAELELLNGDPAELIHVARLCLEEAGGALRLGALAKYDRARAALGIVDPCAAANKISIDAEGPASDALAAGLQFCAGRIIALAPVVTDDRRPEGVHQMRVALRRLRSIEQTFRTLIKGDEIRSLSRRARAVASVLGEARDWDVFLGATLPATAGFEGAGPGFDDLRAGAERLRAEAWARAVAVVVDAEFGSFALDLLETAHLGRWRFEAPKRLARPVRDFAAEALDERMAGAVAQAADLSTKRPDAGHPLRIALKKLRYAAQLFRAIYPAESRKPYFAALSVIQDRFGALNDAVVARTLADRAAAAVSEDQAGEAARDAIRAAGFICGYTGAEAAGAAEEIIALWRDFENRPRFWRVEGNK